MNVQEELPATTLRMEQQASTHPDKTLSLAPLTPFVFLSPAKLCGNSPLLLWAPATGYLPLPKVAYHSVYLCNNCFLPVASLVPALEIIWFSSCFVSDSRSLFVSYAQSFQWSNIPAQMCSMTQVGCVVAGRGGHLGRVGSEGQSLGGNGGSSPQGPRFSSQLCRHRN